MRNITEKDILDLKIQPSDCIKWVEKAFKNCLQKYQSIHQVMIL